MKKPKLTIFCVVLMVLGIAMIGAYIYLVASFECEEYVCSDIPDSWLKTLGIIVFCIGLFTMFLAKYVKYVMSGQNNKSRYDTNKKVYYTSNSEEINSVTSSLEELDEDEKEHITKIIELSSKFSGEELAEEIKKIHSDSGNKTTVTVSSNVRVSQGNKKKQLDEAKALYENGDITKEEYEAMRKEILNIE